MSITTLPNITIIECPHCEQVIEVVELNCRIFRCGVYKHNYHQIDPHMPKIQCEQLVANGEIYGCGKPFKIEVINSSNVTSANINNNNMVDLSFNVVICDYI